MIAETVFSSDRAFAYRSTNPRALYERDDPVGPDNDRHIIERALAARWWCADGARMAPYTIAVLA